MHGALSTADLFLLAAVALCGLGYAEGGALVLIQRSRSIRAPQQVPATADRGRQSLSSSR